MPNSKVQAFVAPYFWLTYELDNKDGKGLYPNIWCEPADALDNTLELMVRNNITNENTANLLKASIKK